jgi:hypothetical protein
VLPIPEPRRGGSVGELRAFVNVPDADACSLLVGWLVQALRPRGPYPVLCLSGEHGAAKSTAARALRSLVDPNVAPLRKEPREDRDLLIAATNSWLVAFDNLSGVPGWLSDALCRLATGGGFATRELYTDADEVLFDAMRPCLLTSIEDIATRGDLLDRCLLQNLPPIPDDRRRPERAFWPEFEAARPRILGGLLDAVRGAMGQLAAVRLPKLPRLADFAEWVVAASPALGWKEDAFLRAYAGNREGANAAALEADPVVPVLLRLLQEAGGEWTGTATDLHRRLGELAGEAVVRDQGWPRRPNVLSGRLRRLAPNLREAGCLVTWDKGPGGKRPRGIVLQDIKKEQGCERSSPPSPSSPTAENAEKCAGAGDDGGRSPARGDDPRDAPNAYFSAAGDDGDDGDDLSQTRSLNIDQGDGPLYPSPF